MSLHRAVLDTIAQASQKEALRQLVRQKLQKQAVVVSASSIDKIIDHILAGRGDTFDLPEEQDGQIVLDFDESDVGNLETIHHQLAERLPDALADAIRNSAKIVFRELRRRWPDQDFAQRLDLQGFHLRLVERWSAPLALLRMLHTICLEIGMERNAKRIKSNSRKEPLTRDVINRLHARSCQVVSEIIVLIENGFADGAMARWRTLHEIDVVASLIARHGEKLASRYVDHQVIEAKRSMDQFQHNHAALGYRPFSRKDAAEINSAFDRMKAKYGSQFAKSFGWASEVLKNPDPKFAHLEDAVGSGLMHSHYKLASENVHANSKGLFFRLGLVEQEEVLLAGPSNFGFAEPGQNAARSLGRLTLLLYPKKPRLDDLIQIRVLADLMDRIPIAFAAAERKLKLEAKQRKQKRPARTAVRAKKS